MRTPFIKRPWIAAVAAGALTLGACATLPADRTAHRAIAADVLRGHDFVAQSCAGCHAVNPTGPSVDRAAPPFRSLAQIHNEETLRRAVIEVSGKDHYRMPRIIITPSEAHDIVAYVRTLQDADPRLRKRLDVPPCVGVAWC